MTNADLTKPRRLGRTALAYAAAGFVATAALIGGIETQAQSIAAHNSRAPVSYAADRIELQDRENRVVLSGNVVIDQADLKVRSERTLVNFNDGDELRIERITASGGVQVTRGNERATGDVAVYDFNRRIITLAGNVALRRGGDTLSGGRLVINLDSGLSSVDGRATGNASSNRVSGSFAVPQGEDQD